jgi:hypothetical protein
LGDVQRHHDDLVTLQEKIDEQRSHYKKAQYAFDKVVDWQEVHTQTPETLSRYNAKQNMKNQILFDYFKKIFDEVKEFRELATKVCKIIWNSSDDILEDLGMETMT